MLVGNVRLCLQLFYQRSMGVFKTFCKLVGSMNITEVKYRYDSCREDALVLYRQVRCSFIPSISYSKCTMVNRMKSAQFQTINLTNYDLAKDHLRYFVMPELCNTKKQKRRHRGEGDRQPGALVKFLDSFSPRWKISLFHYRAQGETGANVLVGIQVPKENMQEFKRRAQDLTYEYTYDNNESYCLPMQ
ncbi:unnamed protein product [Musa banksii]